MATSFPTALDSLTNPSGSDPMNSVTVDHASQHANANDAIEALEAKVGVDSSAVTTSHDYKMRTNLIRTGVSTPITNADRFNQKKYHTDIGRFVFGQGSSYLRDIFAPGGSSTTASSEMLYGYAPAVVINTNVLQTMTFSSGVVDNVGWGTGSSFTTLTVPSNMRGLWSIALLGRCSTSKSLATRQFSEFIHVSGGVTRYYRKTFGLETGAAQRFVIPLADGDTITVNNYNNGAADNYDAILWMNRLGW